MILQLRYYYVIVSLCEKCLISPYLLNDSLVIEEDYYKTLVKPGDHKDYQVSGFNRSRVPHFKFVILMKTAPDEEWLDNTYPIQIVPSQSAS